ncbi:hypothetical protein [Candidatus Protofrankia californiensis]|uniref:hypothetical protein n=1 Tax=Candidatus Protofrankia californiensis TaxID=1839754 RepID=UPI001041BA26|nr:hypothetical protein [Candidatus Protofrankia californiensis]
MTETADVFAMVVDAPEKRTGLRVVIGFESIAAMLEYAARNKVPHWRPAVIDFDAHHAVATADVTVAGRRG